jgi:hypothetical protein
MHIGRFEKLRPFRLTATIFFAMASCGLSSPFLTAGEVVNLAIREKQGEYQLELAMIMNAPFDDVRHVITDYVHIYRIDPSIVESQVLSAPDPSVTRVKTVINDCVLSFCRDILRVEDVREVGDDDIYAVIVPPLSDVRSGTAHWQIIPVGDKTRINYDMTLKPGFFVPPLVGSHLVEKRLQDETLICFNNIERIARIHSVRANAESSMMNETRAQRNTGEHDNAH